MRKWTKLEEERLSQLVQEGLTQTQIGRKLNRTESIRLFEGLRIAPNFDIEDEDTHSNPNSNRATKSLYRWNTDGEGSINFSAKNRVSVYINNSSKELLTWISSAIDSPFTSSAMPRGRKTMHRLTIVRLQDTLVLLETLRPYLIVKSSLADHMIAYCRSRLKYPQGKLVTFTGEELTEIKVVNALNYENGKRSKRIDAV